MAVLYATQHNARPSLISIVLLSACLPVRVLNTVRKREAGKGNPKSLISFSQSPVSTRTCFYYIKRNGKKEEKNMASAGSFIHFFFVPQSESCLSKWKQIKQAINLLLSLWSGPSDWRRRQWRLVPRVTSPYRPFIFFLPKQNIWKIKIITRQLFAASLRTIAIIYTTRNWSGGEEEEALYVHFSFSFFFNFDFVCVCVLSIFRSPPPQSFCRENKYISGPTFFSILPFFFF